MTRKIFVLLFLMPLIVFAKAQKKNTVAVSSKEQSVIKNLQSDTLKLRDKASQTLRELKNGAIIVRLKTNDKSIEAYRKAGQNETANKIIESRKLQNERIYWAFEHAFKFCKVYFIYANQTSAFLHGNNYVFLNSHLEVDSTINFTDSSFVFCEYGSVESFSNFQDYVYSGHGSRSSLDGEVKINKQLDTVPIQTSTSPSTTSGLFFSDKNLKQLYRPFPYVEGVYLDNYAPSVRTLNNEIERAYYKLVVKRDFKEQEKKERRKPKAERKKEKWIP